MKHFNNPQTLEQLKKQYRALAMANHPDKGGDSELMKIINAEYDELFKALKDIRQTKDGDIYTATQTSTETPEHFKVIINELMKMDGIVIEIIGCFVWVTGNTKPHREILKGLKFRWHSKKTAWYLKPDDYKRQSRKDYSLDEIRTMYGTSGEVKAKGIAKLGVAMGS